MYTFFISPPHFALREDEKYCNIKHIAPLHPSIHPPCQSEDCTELHLKRHFPTHSSHSSELLSFLTKSFTLLNKGRWICFTPALLVHCQQRLAWPNAPVLAPESSLSCAFEHPWCSTQISFLVTNLPQMSDWSRYSKMIHSHAPHACTLPDWSKWPVSRRGCRLFSQTHGRFQVYKRDLYPQPDIQRCQPPQTWHAVIT